MLKKNHTNKIIYIHNWPANQPYRSTSIKKIITKILTKEKILILITSFIVIYLTQDVWNLNIKISPTKYFQKIYLNHQNSSNASGKPFLLEIY